MLLLVCLVCLLVDRVLWYAKNSIFQVLTRFAGDCLLQMTQR